MKRENETERDPMKIQEDPATKRTVCGNEIGSKKKAKRRGANSVFEERPELKSTEGKENTEREN